MSALAWIAIGLAAGVACVIAVQCWAALKDDWDEEFPACGGDCNQGRNCPPTCPRGQP